MLKVVFRTFFKVLLGLGAVFAALMLLQRYNNTNKDYIEIYNDVEEELF